MLNSFNFVSTIKNAQRAGRDFVVIRYSKMILRTAQILQECGYIHHWHINGTSNSLYIYFKKNNTSQRNIFSIHIISSKKKSQYVTAKTLWKMNKGLEIYIISTSRGLMTDRKARQLNLGGKLLYLIKNLNFNNVSYWK